MSWLTRILGRTRDVSHHGRRIAQVSLTNTLTSTKELFAPLKLGVVLMYSCGPTVYGPAHIGNLRSYVFSDTLARMLGAAGYRVRRVINITDVGHLTSDADEGEDKMAVGAKREGTTPQDIAERYTRLFLEDLSLLNVDTEDITFPRASDYIQEQIALAKTLEEKGFAYRIQNGLYFDTTRFPNYGKLGNLMRTSVQGETGGSRHRIAPTPGDAVIQAGISNARQWYAHFSGRKLIFTQGVRTTYTFTTTMR